jgi:hypothetical protein
MFQLIKYKLKSHIRNREFRKIRPQFGSFFCDTHWDMVRRYSLGCDPYTVWIGIATAIRLRSGHEGFVRQGCCTIPPEIFQGIMDVSTTWSELGGRV